MQDKINEEIREMIAGYIDVNASELSMDADLDIEYDMDSTEMTEFAKKVEQKYGISIQRSERQDWVSGRDICKFVARKLADSAVTA